MQNCPCLLIVAREGKIGNIITEMLTQKGYSYHIVASAEKARSYLETEQVDLVIWDIEMREQPALGLYKEIVSRIPQTPVLMINGLNDLNTANKGVEAGVRGCIVKPVEPDKLFVQIDNLLRQIRLQEENAMYHKHLEDLVDKRTRALKKNQKELQTILDTVPALIFYKDRGNRILCANKAFADVTGLSQKQLEGRNCSELWPKEADGYWKDDMEVITSGKGKKDILEPITAGGKTKWLLTEKIPHFNEEGEITGVIGFSLDVTELKAAEEALKESEQRFRAISESATDAIVTIDEEDKVTFWNDAAAEVFGYKREEILGRSLHTRVVPEYLRENFKKRFEIFKSTGTGPAVGNTIEFSALRKNGEEFPIELSLSAIRLKDGWHAVGIIRDITKRKKTEEALRRAKADMEYLISSLSTILIELTPELSIRRWNKVAEDILGLSWQHVMNRSLSELSINWEWERVMEAISRCADEKVTVALHDVSFRQDPDRSAILDLSITPEIDDGGEFIGLIIIGSDVTEWRKMEKQLLQSQKLESIGELAAGIAHEINTPTQFIGDNIHFLKEAFGDLEGLLKAYEDLTDTLELGNDVALPLNKINRIEEEIELDYLRREIPKTIDQCMEGVRRVAEIVRAMKEFSHPGGEEKTPVDLNRAIENAITVSRNEWKYIADLETDFDSSLPHVPCLPGEFNQVVLNIIINAAHAIADVVGNASNGKGKITIRTRKNQNWAEVAISDTGPGIPAEILPRIFDPFFTTKDVGKGTGQGLAVAHSIIVKKHNGSLEVETKEGKGTTFFLRLPIESD